MNVEVSFAHSFELRVWNNLLGTNIFDLTRSSEQIRD